MAAQAGAQAELYRLRREIVRIEGRLSEVDGLMPEAGIGPAASFGPVESGRQLKLGAPALDALLGGGLPLATLHEIRACQSRDYGALSGFALALVTRFAASGSVPSVVWISDARIRCETGGLYSPGLIALGLDPARIVEVAAKNETEALWAFEAALSCGDLGVAVCELRQASLELSATRRCILRARDAGVTGFLLRQANEPEPSAAELRFRVSPLTAGIIGHFSPGIGRAAWGLVLEKNRRGRTGVFALEWNAYERSFAERGKGKRRADPQPLPAAPSNRPPYPARAAVADFSRAFLRKAS